MANKKRKKKSHGTPKANSQKKQIKRTRNKKAPSFSDPQTVDHNDKRNGERKPLNFESNGGAKVMIDHFGSVYNMMHGNKVV